MNVIGVIVQDAPEGREILGVRLSVEEAKQALYKDKSVQQANGTVIQHCVEEWKVTEKGSRLTAVHWLQLDGASFRTEVP